MGFRFYRRIPIVPGLITLNLSKEGISLSIGIRGARITLSKNGIRRTIGLPGTGMSHSTLSPWNKPSPRAEDDSPGSAPHAGK